MTAEVFTHNGFTITLDNTQNARFDETGLTRLKDSYFFKGETNPQERYAYVCAEFASDQEHANRLYHYVSNHWLSFSTPILSYHREKKALPISCYLAYLPDSKEGLIETQKEANLLSMAGGGVGIHVGLRAADEKSVGSIPHMKTYDSNMMAFKQGSRRGSFATYLNVDHPDVRLFIEMRKPTGDQNLRCLNLHHGLNITDEFMEIIEKAMRKPKPGEPRFDDSFHLVCPHSGKIVETVSAKELWQHILSIRSQTGEPYLHFIDSANRALPLHLKQKGMTIKGSNLCAEIELVTDEERTAVCCLSSENIVYYDQYKPVIKQFREDVARMLDNVLTVFIRDASPELHRAVRSAQMERSIGIGVLGFHDYLQQKNIAFESALAKSFNKRFFKEMREMLDEINLKLGAELGECPDAVGHGLRFSHMMAVAPTATSSIIMGNTSPSIEPFYSNIYRQDTSSGSSTKINHNLEKLLRSRLSEEEFADVKTEIIINSGSVQNLACLSEHEREVFKTAFEIDMRWVVDLAGDRAAYIDQGQSINLWIRPDAPIKYLHAVHFKAWKAGVKALYYLRSENVLKAEKVGERIERHNYDVNLTNIVNNDECLACQ